MDVNLNKLNPPVFSTQYQSFYFTTIKPFLMENILKILWISYLGSSVNNLKIFPTLPLAVLISHEWIASVAPYNSAFDVSSWKRMLINFLSLCTHTHILIKTKRFELKAFSTHTQYLCNTLRGQIKINHFQFQKKNKKKFPKEYCTFASMHQHP